MSTEHRESGSPAAEHANITDEPLNTQEESKNPTASPFAHTGGLEITARAAEELGTAQAQGLFKHLNNTQTRMGARLLARELSKQTADEPLCKARLAAVERLMASDALLELQRILRKLPDMHRLQARLRCAPSTAVLPAAAWSQEDDEPAWEEGPLGFACCLSDCAKYVAITSDLALLLPRLAACCARAPPSGVLKDSLAEAERLLATPQARCVAEELDRIVSAEFSPAGSAVCDAAVQLIAPGVDERIDLARAVFYKNMAECQEVLAELTGTHGATAQRDPVHGVCVLCKEPTQALITLRTLRRGVLCTTPRLQALSHRLAEASEQIVELTGRHCRGLLSRCGWDFLAPLSAAVAELDVRVSAALYARRPGSISPTVGGAIRAAALRHPLLPSAVPNACLLSSELRFTVITGPNAAGKSTYAKAVSLALIAAHTGNYVRAAAFTHSRLARIDYVRTRRDVQRLVSAPLPRPSLVVVDELEAPLAEQLALCDWLVSEQAFVLYVTHSGAFLKHLRHLSCLNVVRVNLHVAAAGTNTQRNASAIIKDSLPGALSGAFEAYRALIADDLAVFDNTAVQAAAVVQHGSRDDQNVLQCLLAPCAQHTVNS